MRSLLRRWRGRPLDAEEAATLAAERVERNRRRIVVMGALMVGLHAVHVWHFRIAPDERASLNAVEERWRDGLTSVHLGSLGFAAAIALVAAFVRSPAVRRALGPIAFTGYLVHGALISGIDQLITANMTAYVGYAFGLALVIALTPLEAALAYAIGLTTLLTTLATYSPPDALQTNLPSSITITIVGVVVAMFADGVRRRELIQRLTIERQRAQLAGFNADLERRVREQVDEIIARAAEVERLNAELQGQVRARSTELSFALQRLAKQMEAAHGIESGSVIADRFVVEEVIGEGGMGRVHAGRDRDTSAKVAIKVLQVSSSRQLDSLRRFIREAGATATITHPAVVRILAFDVSADGLLYLVQELVEGVALARRLDPRWPFASAARLGAVLAQALAAAHAQGVIHRDVKPDNVMLTRTPPGLKLVDFGVAKLLDAAAFGDATAETVVVGTPAYMAPEQVSSGVEVTDRADVYAVGVMLHRMIAGALPVDADTAHELVLRKLNDVPPRIPGLPAPHADLIRRCLAPRAEERPSAAELAEQLRRFADEATVPPLETIALGPAGEAATAVERKR